MDILKHKLHSVRSSISGLSGHRKSMVDNLEIHSPTRSHSESPMRGGDEKEITSRISSEHRNSTVDALSDSGSDFGEPHVKTIDDFLNNNADPPEVQLHYGRLAMVQSARPYQPVDADAPWWHLEQMTTEQVGERVVFRGRVHAVRHMSAKLAFIVFREGITTIQGVLRAKEGLISENMVRFAEHMRTGTIVVTKGVLKLAEQRVKLTSIHDVEIEITDLHVETARTAPIPFSVYEAEQMTDEHKLSDRVRLANRILDLRTPTSQGIFRVQAAICRLFRNYLDDQRFVEIHTPKLQGGATEGGSEVFKLNYFGRPAFLAQSPQLAKQMSISADFQRVYEVGPVFRAENSNTPRHLTEYTGLDIEMAIDKHYHEAMFMIDAALKHIFAGLYQRHRAEIDAVKHHFPHDDLVWMEETVRITFAQGAQMLRESGWVNEDGQPQSPLEDLPTRAERELGRLVKEQFGTDYYILDKFPRSVRPFYTMPDPHNPDLTNSFDFMLRGQEILSGGQRIHDHDMLKDNLEKNGIDPKTLQEYMNGFAYVAPPHAGAGIGLERLTSLVLELGNLRYASLFHRDPKSFPQPPKSELRYPEATTLTRPKGQLQPLPDLIANYGDSTNTSWQDPRFQIWRDDKTGAAIAYTPMHGRAICAGDPLCDESQFADVTEAFTAWVRETKNLKPIWILVGAAFEEILGTRYGFRSFTVCAEQRVDLEREAHVKIDKEVDRKIRHAQHEGIKVEDYGHDIPAEMQSRVEARISEWQSQRKEKGDQVRLSEINPFIDKPHRQYFVALDTHGQVHTLVVLAQLSLRHGTQVKWALDFPGSSNGSIELTVLEALKAAASSGEHSATFGAGATPDLKVGHHIGSTKAASLGKMYTSITRSFHLENKTGFRTKFNTVNDLLYIAYPAKGLGQKGIRAIVDFFRADD